jgi:hypothetical protein
MEKRTMQRIVLSLAFLTLLAAGPAFAKPVSYLLSTPGVV